MTWRGREGGLCDPTPLTPRSGTSTSRRLWQPSPRGCGPKETWGCIDIAAVTLFVHNLAQHISSRDRLCPVAVGAAALRKLLRYLGCSDKQQKALVRSHTSSAVRGCPSNAEKGFGSTNVARVLSVVVDAFGLGVPFRVVPPHRQGREGNESDFTDVMTDVVSTIAIFASAAENAHRLDPSGGVARRLQQAGEAVGDEGSVLEVAVMFQRLAAQGPADDLPDNADNEEDVDDVPEGRGPPRDEPDTDPGRRGDGDGWGEMMPVMGQQQPMQLGGLSRRGGGELAALPCSDGRFVSPVTTAADGSAIFRDKRTGRLFVRAKPEDDPRGLGAGEGVGEGVGASVGLDVGASVGACVGASVGVDVGLDVGHGSVGDADVNVEEVVGDGAVLSAIWKFTHSWLITSTHHLRLVTVMFEPVSDASPRFLPTVKLASVGQLMLDIAVELACATMDPFR